MQSGLKVGLLLAVLIGQRDGKCMKGWLDNEPLLGVKPRQKCGIYYFLV